MPVAFTHMSKHLQSLEPQMCYTSVNPLSSTTETGLQSIAFHLATELVNLSKVDLLSLRLNSRESVLKEWFLMVLALVQI